MDMMLMSLILTVIFFVVHAAVQSIINFVWHGVAIIIFGLLLLVGLLKLLRLLRSKGDALTTEEVKKKVLSNSSNACPRCNSEENSVERDLCFSGSDVEATFYRKCKECDKKWGDLNCIKR